MRFSLRSLALAALLLAATIIAACSDQEVALSPDDVLSVRFGASEECLGALAHAAQGGGMFEDAGLDVEYILYESSLDVVDAVAAGEVDVGTGTDIPVVLATLKGADMDIVATIGSYNNDIVIVARRSEDLTSQQDLRGKRVGTREGTAAHFFLHSLLIRYGMSDDDIEYSFAQFDELPQALARGEVDAVAVRPPHIFQAQEALGSDALTLEEPGLYEKTMNLVAAPDVDLEVRRRLVSALIAAEERYAPQPRADMRAVVADTLDVTEEELCDSMGYVEFSVTLSQSLVLGLEDQARWARESGMVAADAGADFLGIVDTAALDDVDPRRISIIR